MKEEGKSTEQKAPQQKQELSPEKQAKNAMLIDLLKRSTVVYNTVIQGKMLDANDIQKIDNVFLSLLILNERNYFENAIKKKPLEKEKFESYIKMRHKFIMKQLETMLTDLENKLFESRDKQPGAEAK